MKILSSTASAMFSRRARRQGSTLVIALIMVTVLSMVAACVLASISARYNSAFRSASWNDALLAAESGVDTTLADLLGFLPDVRVTGAGIGTGYTQDADPLKFAQQPQLFTNGLLNNGTELNFQTAKLDHGGEGGTSQQASVNLKAMSLTSLFSGGASGALNGVGGLLKGDMSLLRLRSTGTVLLTGGTVAGPSRLDNDLWRVSLLTDRLTGKTADAPSVSRQVEVLLRPVYPFESAASSDDALLATGKGVVFDSFNSAVDGANTNGEYDSAKRLTNGSVLANGSNVSIGGKVYGDIGTGGGNVAQDANLLTGTVNNAFYAPLPPLKVPSMPAAVALPPVLFGTLNIAAGTNNLPTQYVLSGITSFGKLHITNGGVAANTDVVVYVNGNIYGGIEVDPGVTAKVYVSGSIDTAASKLQNDSRRAANLQIYGVPAAGTTPTIRLNNDGNLIAAIYAPAHAVYMDGNNDLSGAVVARRFETTKNMRFHYDEALALSVGPVLRYKIIRWREITN